MTRYSQLYISEQRKVDQLQKTIDRMSFEIALLRAFIQSGHQDSFAEFVLEKMAATTQLPNGE